MSKTVARERRAVVLLSGGIDSTVTAYLARRDVGKEGKLHAISFAYGQLHKKELAFASDIGVKLEMESHPLIKVLGMELFGEMESHPLIKVLGMELFGSSLVGGDEEPIKRLETMKSAFGMAYGPSRGSSRIPSTWVPQRNSFFLALAYAYAETVGASSVYIGVNSVDYSGYPDCRPEFIVTMCRALNLASKQAVEEGKRIGIETPLQYLSKVEIISKGLEMGVDFSKTWSCYCGRELACGKCPSCLIRLEAFSKLEMKDPARYEEV